MKKRLFKPLAAALAAALQLTVHAAVPVAWTNSPGMPPYPIKPVPHGSTVDLAVTLKGYTTPPIADGADVRLWYQTNGMGSAWWSAPATFDGSTITATFGPAQDCGADRVSLFFGAPSNVFASAVLRLTHAPGFSPASLPLPVPVLDFSAVELRNLSALTNGWSFGSTPGDYETVRNKTTAIGLEDEHWRFYGMADNAMGAQTASELIGLDGLHRLYFDDGEGRWISDEYYGLETRGLAYLYDIPSPPDLTPYATKSALQSVSNIVEDVRTESALVYRLYSGSNVVAEVTNYNSAVHAPTLRLMQLNESNEYVTVWAETNGLTRTLNEAKEYADGATNELKNVYAPRAWSRTTSGLGADAPSNTTWISTEKLVIASGQEYVEIESSGVWVLCTNGQVDFSAKTNSFFTISDNSGNPVFSVERAGAAPIPVYCGEIRVHNSGDSKIVTVPVPVFDVTENKNDPPYLNVATDLQGTWYSETNGIPSSIVTSCTWSGQNGAWTNTVVVPATHQHVFFTYHKWQPGGTIIRNNATTDLSFGIYVNGVKFVPSVSGNNLIWTKQ